MTLRIIDTSTGTQLRSGGASGLTAALRTYLSTEAGSAAVLLGSRHLSPNAMVCGPGAGERHR
jgi:hypothetical protein